MPVIVSDSRLGLSQTTVAVINTVVVLQLYVLVWFCLHQSIRHVYAAVSLQPSCYGTSQVLTDVLNVCPQRGRVCVECRVQLRLLPPADSICTLHPISGAHSYEHLSP